jgi:beta-fructofuranosidase
MRRVDRAMIAGAALFLAAPASSQPVTLERDGDVFRLGEYILDIHAPHRPIVAVEGGALRFDGNSTWGITPELIALPTEDGFALGAWVALASPPGEAASVIEIARDGVSIMALAVNPWLQPEFRIGELRAATFDAIPLGEWVHLGATYADGEARLFMNGEEVARHAGEPSSEPLAGKLAIGRSLTAGIRDGAHQLGVWNGVIADMTLSVSEVEPVRPEPARAVLAPIDVPDAWFADDHHRPRMHPMPPAGWTNEPHTFHHRDGHWQLYHQANPNGAYWDHIVWGHLVSEDLVDWQPRLPALIPGTGFDRRGIWVGNLIPGIEPPEALYTGVDGHRSGLGRAVARADGSFERITEAIAYNTPEGYQDMRDPFIVETDDGWLALVGGGALDRSRALILAFASSDAREWKFVGEVDTGGVAMPGEYWELPVLMPLGEHWLMMGTPVIRGEPGRTLYWIGDFDGERFTPVQAEPRRFDLFKTLLAPSIALGPDGRMYAIGVIPDEQRGEPERAAAGWVHALSLPLAIAACEGATRLCASQTPEVRAAFSQTLIDERDIALSSDAEWRDPGEGPLLLRAEVSVPDGVTARIGLRADEASGEVTRLLLRPAEGLVGLDFGDASQADWARSDIVWSEIGRNESVTLELVLDGAAITGTINGAPTAFLSFPESRDARGLVFDTDNGSAVLERLSIARRP